MTRVHREKSENVVQHERSILSESFSFCMHICTIADIDIIDVVSDRGLSQVRREPFHVVRIKNEKIHVPRCWENIAFFGNRSSVLHKKRRQ